MSSTEQQTAQLMNFIKDLPDKELRKLAAAIELDRNDNKLGLPHNAIMAMLRPSLALIRAPRALIPQRAFCLPFEDMLVNQRDNPRPDGQILRSAITPMWDWLVKDLEPSLILSTSGRYIKAQKESNDAEISRLSAELWSIGADALTEGLAKSDADEGQLAQLTEHMGGPDGLADLREMAACLRIADPLEKLKASLPAKPMVDLNKEQMVLAAEAYSAAEAINPADSIILLLALMGRMLRPFPILRLIKTITRSSDDFMLQKTDMALPGNLCFDKLDQDARAVVQAADIPDTGDLELIPKVAYFAEGFRAITDSIGIKRDGEWGQRMHAARGQVSECLERRLLREAQKIVLAAVPSKSGGTVPKLAEHPDLTKFELAEDRAQALGALMPIADQVGLKSECSSKVSALQKELEKYSDALLKVLPQAPADKIPIAFAYLCIAVRLIEVMISADEADSLRKRGIMALEAAGG